jgi:3-dehydroquinate dehydratase I
MTCTAPPERVYARDMKRLCLGTLDLCRNPAVVGTVTDLASVAPGRPLPCDAVELRLDQLGVDTPGWQVACRRLEQAGMPTILTLRHAAEGGAWHGTGAERLAILAPMLPVASGVDVEIRRDEAAGIRTAAGREDLLLIGSYHDFIGMPDDDALDRVVEQGAAQGVDLVKIAARTESDADVERLRALLTRFPHVPLALVGMGSRGPDSRISLPRAGSCLTYGFLDASVAPGQVAAETLLHALRTTPARRSEFPHAEGASSP